MLDCFPRIADIWSDGERKKRQENAEEHNQIPSFSLLRNVHWSIVSVPEAPAVGLEETLLVMADLTNETVRHTAAVSHEFYEAGKSATAINGRPVMIF